MSQYDMQPPNQIHQAQYRPNFRDLRKYLILWAKCVYTQKKNNSKNKIDFSGPGLGNGKRVRKSAHKVNNSVHGCPCILFLLQTQCLVCAHFFKLSLMKLLWPALQLKAKGQKYLIFVVGLYLVWFKRLRSLPHLPRSNFDVALFAQTIVTQLVEEVLAQEVAPPN